MLVAVQVVASEEMGMRNYDKEEREVESWNEVGKTRKEVPILWSMERCRKKERKVGLRRKERVLNLNGSVVVCLSVIAYVILCNTLNASHESGLSEPFCISSCSWTEKEIDSFLRPIVFSEG
jgi:hypothetical protein